MTNPLVCLWVLC